MAGTPGIRIGGFERTFRDDEARAQILTKANAADVYTKAEADTRLNDKADASTTYTKIEVDTKIGAKADATTAVTHTALTAVGSGTQPVYINSSGVATATTYSLAKSVPSDAKFTDTTYSDATTSAHGLMTAADKTKLNAISDYITSSGTSGIWGYIKWNSGIAWCFSTSDNKLIKKGQLTNVSFTLPFNFTNAYYTVLSETNSDSNSPSGFYELGKVVGAKTTSSFSIFYWNVNPDSYWRTSVLVIGRWK